MPQLLKNKLHFFVLLLATPVFSVTSTDYGRQMVLRAHQSICWYEYLKSFPETNSRAFGNCYTQGPHVLKQIVEQKLDDKYFGQWMTQLAMTQLPDHYQGCKSFLKNPKQTPKVDYRDILNETTEIEYPFRGFSHCLVEELQKKHGKKALVDLKKRISKKDNWKVAILERENEFRARHDSEPLVLAKELSVQAQKWADKIAKECNAYHSKGSDPDRQFQGEGTGESLAMATVDESKVPAADSALVAVSGWYEEIKDYPYPEGYKGDGSDSLFPKIGHFTQTVWKESKHVGYGYALNKECSGFKTYIVARYYPAGNMIGDFEDNVKPPNDKVKKA